MYRSKKLAYVLLLVIGLHLVVMGFPRTIDGLQSGTELAGPYLGGVEYHVIEGDQSLVESILDNELDLIDDILPESYFETLEQADDVEVSRNLQNSYGVFVINCGKYPLNITAFRRAAAFALDKTGLSEVARDGQCEPLDSCVPKINPLSIEGTLDYSYYDQQLDRATAILDAAGFHDIDSDGFREAPDGSRFQPLIEVAMSSQTAIDAGQFMLQALHSVGIDAHLEITDYYEYLTRLYYHGDFEIAFTSMNQGQRDLSLEWLAFDYTSLYTGTERLNAPNFSNATYDYWAEKLLYSVDYEDIAEAATKLQEIWIYESPSIVCYEPYFCNAYRTDRFTGFVSTPIEGLASWWTNYHVQLKENAGGPFGGTLRISSTYDRGENFNIFGLEEELEYRTPLPLYDTLVMNGPDGRDIPWLAKSITAETHADNPQVTEGYTRFRVEIVDNATWTDGTPLTAQDVSFSFNYYRDAPGHPNGPALSDLRACYAMTNTSLTLEFETESYWHVHTINRLPIIPKHVFVDIGLDGWSDWSPDPPEETMVTSGPFNVSSYVPNEVLELQNNPDYFRRPSESDSNSVVHPSVSSSDDVVLPAGYGETTVNWTVTNASGSEYSLYLNSSQVSGGIISSGTAEVRMPFNQSQPGVYNCTICVRTSDGFSCSDTVWVRVEDSILGQGPELHWILNPVSLAVTAIAVAIIFVVGSKLIREMGV
ncbi:hypothetical protein EU546_03735 [Candidatus Thorarchaeota archaeon]|nr:MAG: hypothetical protein EU546_03735 [Candidatus Thorarchaeota archaeon]